MPRPLGAWRTNPAERAAFTGQDVPVRLQKYLADCGVASRRKCEDLIRAGRVTVNNAPASLGESVDPETDTVLLDGERIVSDRRVYVLLNKPKGVITSVQDTHNRRTVIDLLSGVEARVFPVGRLDLDVGGTLLLTNDGELSHQLTHPKFGVHKIYMAWVAGRMSDETAARLANGVPLDDGMTSPAKVEVLKYSPRNSTLIRLTIHEGRKRMVKRMCAAVGHPVRDLHRVSFGGVSAENLRPGEWRYLSADEVKSLREAAHSKGNAGRN
jgi:23S rRNA pseudouridine2605 synthase